MPVATKLKSKLAAKPAKAAKATKTAKTAKVKTLELPAVPKLKQPKLKKLASLPKPKAVPRGRGPTARALPQLDTEALPLAGTALVTQPTPQITSPLAGAIVTAGADLTVSVQTNRGDLGYTVELTDITIGSAVSFNVAAPAGNTFSVIIPGADLVAGHTSRIRVFAASGTGAISSLTVTAQ